jgi:hypothetical protein
MMKKKFVLDDIDVYRDGVSEEARTDMLDLFARRMRCACDRAGAAPNVAAPLFCRLRCRCV